MNGAKRMYTVSGQEVRSFSQLRNEFADADTFYLGVGSVGGAVMMSPIRRSRSRQPQTAIVEDISKQRRARSKSRPRALYAPESEIVRNSGKRVFIQSMLIIIPCSSIRLYFIRSTERGTRSGNHKGFEENLLPADSSRTYGQFAARKENAIRMGVSFKYIKMEDNSVA